MSKFNKKEGPKIKDETHICGFCRSTAWCLVSEQGKWFLTGSTSWWMRSSCTLSFVGSPSWNPVIWVMLKSSVTPSSAMLLEDSSTPPWSSMNALKSASASRLEVELTVMLEHLRSMPRCESLRVAAVLRSYSYSLEESGRRCGTQRDQEQQGNVTPPTLNKRPGPGGTGGAVSL